MPRLPRAAAWGLCLSALTALTRLNLNLRCLESPCDDEPDDETAAHLTAALEAQWRALVTAARCMPGLRELHTSAAANAAELP